MFMLPTEFAIAAVRPVPSRMRISTALHLKFGLPSAARISLNADVW